MNEVRLYGGGESGLSAYEEYVLVQQDAGAPVLDRADWLASLQGPPGLLVDPQALCWSASAHYAATAVVTEAGSSWMARRNTQGERPSESPDAWEVLAQGVSLAFAEQTKAEVETIGAEKVAQAAAQASAAALDRSAAEAARAASEAARDAAAVRAGEAAAAAGGVIYATTAAGIAAVADGAYFLVAGDGVASYALLYRRSGASAVSVAAYPSRDGILANFAVAGVTSLFWAGLSGVTISATTAANMAGFTPGSSSLVALVTGAAIPVGALLSANGGPALPIRDSDGSDFASVTIAAATFLVMRYFTTPDNHWRVELVSLTARTMKGLGTLPERGMRARGILAAGVSVAAQVTPGTYRLSSGAGYTGLPSGYPTGAAGMLVVYDPGNANGEGAPDHVIQEVMSQVPLATGGAQAYHPRWMRRAALADPAIITGNEAWTPCTPVDPYLGNLLRSRGPLPAGDLNLVWQSGIYQGSGGSAYSGRPAEFASGSFELMVTEYGGAGGMGQGRFVRQLMTDLTVSNAGTPQAFRRQYERVIDTTAPASTSSQYAWIARHAVGGAYAGRTAVVLGDSVVQGETGFDFCPLLAAATGMTVVNGGFGGCRMAQHPSDANRDALSFHRLADYIATGNWAEATAAAAALQAVDGNALRVAHAAALAALSWSSVSYVLVMFGTNDFTGVSPDGPVPLGSAGDTTAASFRGAINYGIQRILAAYPKARLIFATPLWRARVNGGVTGGTYTPPGGVIDDSNLVPNSAGVFLSEYAAAIRERAAAHQIPVIDLHRLGGINRFNWQAYIPDGLHPTANADGIGLMAERLAAGMRAVV